MWERLLGFLKAQRGLASGHQLVLAVPGLDSGILWETAFRVLWGPAWAQGLSEIDLEILLEGVFPAQWGILWEKLLVQALLALDSEVSSAVVYPD